MRIVIDVDRDAQGNVIAQHVLHTDPAPWNMVQDPTNPANQISIIQMLAIHNGNPTLRAASGYNTARWGRVVAAANSPQAEPALRALNLR